MITGVLAQTKVPINRKLVQELLTVNVHTKPIESGSWVVTLGRVERDDSHIPQQAIVGDPVGTKPVYISQLEGFNAAFQSGVSFIPPSRTFPLSNLIVENPFVIIKFKTLGVVNNLLAHWPMQGGSVVVHGSDIEVYAVVAVGATSPTPNDLPRFGATISKCDYNNPSQNGTLGLTQRQIAVADPLFSAMGPNLGGNVVGVPDFARSVRVTLAKNPSLAYPTVPIDVLWPLPNAQSAMVWYDDNGNIIYTELVLMNGNSQSYDVPPAATQMGLYRLSLDDPRPDNIFLHWRISP